jgi:hypothetical protein
VDPILSAVALSKVIAGGQVALGGQPFLRMELNDATTENSTGCQRDPGQASAGGFFEVVLKSDIHFP